MATLVRTKDPKYPSLFFTSWFLRLVGIHFRGEKAQKEMWLRRGHAEGGKGRRCGDGEAALVRSEGREVEGKHAQERLRGHHARALCVRGQSGGAVMDASCSPCACVYTAVLCTLNLSVH